MWGTSFSGTKYEIIQVSFIIVQKNNQRHLAPHFYPFLQVYEWGFPQKSPIPTRRMRMTNQSWMDYRIQLNISATITFFDILGAALFYMLDRFSSLCAYRKFKFSTKCPSFMLAESILLSSLVVGLQSVLLLQRSRDK